MKITLFGQAPYRHLPPDFEQHYSSVCNTPYSLVTRDGMYSSIRDYIDELMAGARAGFDGIAVTEHGQNSFDMTPNPDVVAGALAYATETEGLDVAIYPMGRSLGKAREPVRVAEEYALVDVMSGGRLVAGFPVGLAWDAGINNGVPPLQIRPRFEENFELILRSWAEQEPFPWNGKYSQYPEVNIWPRPLQPRPPVWITGTGNPRTMRMTLERDFGFNYFGIVGTKLTGQRIFDRFWEIADEAGVARNPYRVGFMQTVAVAETDERAEREYGQHLERGFRHWMGAVPPDKRNPPGAIDIRGVRALMKDAGDYGLYGQMRTVTFSQLAEAGAVIVGGPATVREQLAEFCRSYGVGNLHVMLGFGSLPRELVMKNVRLFAEEVAPYLRGLWTDGEFEHHWWPERLGGTPRAAAPGMEPVRKSEEEHGKVSVR
jgi:alkanesulfonate monooxygenase SsuD/methylene tetrahydromethanopterin reductase-like flavin-dependent oxidoreductase (luciferase family)